MSLPYTTIPMPEAGSPEWHRLRRENGIGASESPAVLGFSPYAGPADIYAIKRELVEPTESTRAMRAGSALEPFICSEFQRETGIQGIKPDFMAKSIEFPWMFADLDFLATDRDAIGEFKRSNVSSLWGPSGSDIYPEGYFVQCQHGLLVTMKATCYLTVLLPFDDLRTYEIQANQDIQEAIASGTGTFWNQVQQGIMPEDGAMNRETIQALFKEFTQPIEIADPECAQWLQRHKSISETMKNLEAEMEQIKNRLMLKMGNAKKATVIGWNGTMTRSEIKGGHVSYDKKPSTQFRINHSKKED